MNLLSRIVSRKRESRQLVELLATWQTSKAEGLADASSFQRYVTEGLYGNGVVFAVILSRLMLFSEATFRFRKRETKALFDDDSLRILERPWPNGTTGELLARMEQDVSLAGNFYAVKPKPDRLQRLRPDWVEIVTDGKEVVGYSYAPGGKTAKQRRFFLPEETCHWSPIPDPLANFRGMSWLTPVAREVDADVAMTRHKSKFFDNAATPNLLVKFESKLDKEDKEKLREEFERRYGSVDNAYKTVVVDGGADLTVIGHSFEQMTFSVVQAAGENRICVAGGVPAIVVGLKEGLQASTYSNYQQAMRRFGDMWARPQWRSAAAALSVLVTPPSGAELWYDADEIAALREDSKDRAEVFLNKAQAAAVLIRVGYDPAQVGAVVEALTGLDQLSHSGGIPVTLYEEGVDPKAAEKGRLAPLEQILERLAAIEAREPVVVNVEAPKPRTKRVKRDDSGRIEAVEEE
jgi:HK97 family phage portal protein